MTAAGLIGACASGPGQIRLEPPSLQVESLRVDEGTVYFRLLLHNRNDHDIFLSEANVGMRIDGSELFSDTWQLDLDVGPRGRELVSLDAPARQEAADLLSTAGSSGAGGMPFELAAEILMDSMRNAEISVKGFLHPVPGQPGTFR